MQKHPDCTLTLNNFWRVNRKYKTLTSQKKCRAIAELHAKLEAAKINNPWSFWNKIRATKQTTEEPIPININHFYTHFSNLNDGPLPTKLIKATPGNEINSLTDKWGLTSLNRVNWERVGRVRDRQCGMGLGLTLRVELLTHAHEG